MAAAAGAYVAFLVHGAIDWDWKVAALATTGLFCGGIVLVGTRRGPTTTISPGIRAVLLGGTVALVALALVRLETGADLGF